MCAFCEFVFVRILTRFYALFSWRKRKKSRNLLKIAEKWLNFLLPITPCIFYEFTFVQIFDTFFGVFLPNSDENEFAKKRTSSIVVTRFLKILSAWGVLSLSRSQDRDWHNLTSENDNQIGLQRELTMNKCCELWRLIKLMTTLLISFFSE